MSEPNCYVCSHSLSEHSDDDGRCYHNKDSDFECMCDGFMNEEESLRLLHTEESAATAGA